MSNLTLWDIDKALDELFEALDEADTEEGREACRRAIAEYQAREVSFIDNARGAYKHYEALAIAARQEVRDMEARARMFERRCESIKAMAQVVMEAHAKTKLDGRRGRFLLKGNGGLLPLVVTDPAAVPDECCKMAGWIRADTWRMIRDDLEDFGELQEGVDYAFERGVDNGMVREELSKPCGVCRGTGKDPLTMLDESAEKQVFCAACGGSGKHAIPGARLGERGKHVEVK